MRRGGPSSSCVSRGWSARLSAARGRARSRSSRQSDVYNEIQAGSYVFMDADYARNLDEAGAPISTFRHSLFVLATVMSAPQPEHRGRGRGPQGRGGGQRLPTVWQRPDIRYVSASDEHGKLEVRFRDGRAEAGRETAVGAGTL